MKEKPRIRVFYGYELDKKWTEIAQRISDLMVEKYKLSYPDIDYHFISLDDMASVVANHGWIIYPRTWEEGQNYYLRKLHQILYGESILEIVVESGERNSLKAPIKAYVNASISDTYKKLVISHVLGHAHIFYNNEIERKFRIKDPISFLYNLTQKINEYEGLYGEDKVQDFIETIKHLSTLIDLYPTPKVKKSIDIKTSKDLERKLNLIEKSLRKERKIPPRKEYDILRFLIKYAPLEDWQRDLLKDYRKLFYFLYSGARIKILHEGFSSLIGMLYFLEDNEISEGEYISFAKGVSSSLFEPHLGSGLIREGFNPYFLGLSLLLHALDKYTNEAYGMEYDWERKWYKRIRKSDLLSIIRNENFEKAWEKILEIARTYDDFTLINQFFDIEFYNKVARNYYFVYEGENYPWDKKIVVSRDYNELFKTFLFNTYNLNLPRVYIPVNGGKYNKKEEEITGELLLIQDTSFPEVIGIKKQQLTLDVTKEKEVLKALYKIWKKPVNLKTFKVKFKYKPLPATWWWYYWMWQWYYYGNKIPSTENFLEEAEAEIIDIIDRYDGEKFESKEIN